MKREFVRIEPGNKGRFIKPFTAVYTIDGKEYRYEVVSRHNPENKRSCDAVAVVGIYSEDGKNYLVVNKQFRYAIGSYNYELPAGLIDEGEDLVQAGLRELNEETGAVANEGEILIPPAYISAGMGDEKIAVILANVDHFDKTHLETEEDIETTLVDIDELDAWISKAQEQYPVEFKIYSISSLIRQRFATKKTKSKWGN